MDDKGHAPRPPATMRTVFPAVARPSAPATNVFHDVLLAAALLLLEGHACVVVGQSYSGKCPGGGLALTPDLYQKGYGAYKDAACIPNGAFCHLNVAGYCSGSPGLAFTGDVTLTNLEQLAFVGEQAFLDFRGTLTLRNAFPRLKEIGANAFFGAGDFASLVALDGAAVAALEKVGNDAFQTFAGKVAITGAFPNLTAINAGAFYGAANNNNLVAIRCRGGTWEVGSEAFAAFHGVHNATGENCSCSAPCNPSPPPSPPGVCNVFCIPQGVKRKDGQPACCTEGRATSKCPGPANYLCGSDTLAYVCISGQCKRNLTGATFAECNAQCV